MQFTERCNLESILRGLSRFSCDPGRRPALYTIASEIALWLQFFGIAIVQNADSYALFDRPDTAPQRGWSAQRIFSLRPVNDPFPTEAICLIERQIGVFDRVLVHLNDRPKTRDREARARSV
jgi:hypothetical protein